MKTAGVIVFAIVVYVVALVAFLPATFIDREVEKQTGGKLRFADATGTVWNGRGAIASPGSAWQIPVAFTIDKADVARGTHRISLQPVDGATTPRGVVDVVNGGVRARDLSADVPASALTTLLPMRGLPVAGGALAITAGVFDWTPSEGDGGMNARWRNARLVIGESVADLGNVELALSSRTGQLSGRLTNIGGDVKIDGNLVVAGGGATTVDATIAPAASAPANVTHALAALGTPDANGAVRIAWRGNLR